MTDQICFPPLLDLPVDELEILKQHLLSEIAREPERRRLALPVILLFRGRRRRSWKLAAAVAAAVAAGAAVAASNIIGAGTPPMPTAAQWANFGVTIGPAQGVPSVSAEAARQSASKAAGADVLNSSFAHCQDPNAVPPINQDCYLELVDPVQVSTQTGKTVAWAVVMVDPTTGKAFHWYSAKKTDYKPIPVPSCWPCSSNGRPGR